MKKFFTKKFLQLNLILFIIFIITVLLYYFGFLYLLEVKFSDLRFKIRGPLKPSDKIIIIGIDENSLEAIGRWPWDRKLLSKGIENIYKVGAKVVGLDILFPEPSNPVSDLKLAQSFRLGNTVIAAHFERRQINTIKNVNGKQILVNQTVEELVLPIDKFLKNAKIGFTNVYPDSDGVLRKINLINKNNQGYNFSFDKIIAQSYNNEITDKIPEKFLINYYGPSGIFTKYSFLLTQYDSFADFIKDKLKDKIVLIGSMATAAYDHFPTPFQSAFPGVEVHANVIENILSGTYLKNFNKSFYIVLLYLISFLTMVVFYKINPIGILVSVIFGSLLYYFFTVVIFIKLRYVIDVIPFFVMIFSSAIINIINKVLEEQKEKNMMKGVFSRYVSPAVMDEILNKAEALNLGGKKEEITIMFTDIRKFTTLSEQLSPEEVVGILNQYFESMNKIVFKYNGTLDKYIGDAIMCFWNAPVKQPDHAERAVKCAIEMVEELKNLNQIFKEQGKPELAIGVGINTGYAIVGNVGSSQMMEYTVVGDTINIAARLQDLTKEYFTPIVISKTVNDLVKDKIETIPLGKMVVKGKTKEVDLFKIKGYSY